MRPIERIDNFLKLVDWQLLLDRWNITDFKHYDLFTCEDCGGEAEDEEGNRCDTCDAFGNIMHKFIKYWKENPDQRIGQVLINLNLIPDSFKIWIDEESDILISQGIAPEECLYWTSIYDKEENLLKVPINRLISELETDHINAILIHPRLTNISNVYRQAFNNVLEYRDNLEQDELISDEERESINNRSNK